MESSLNQAINIGWELTLLFETSRSGGVCRFAKTPCGVERIRTVMDRNLRYSAAGENALGRSALCQRRTELALLPEK